MNTSSTTGAPLGRRRGALDFIEWAGNKLPDPATLFLLGALLVMVVSHAGYALNWEVQRPVTRAVTAPVLDAAGEPVTVLRAEMIDRRLTLLRDDGGSPIEHPVATAQVNPETGRLLVERATEPVRARSLLSRDGLFWAFETMVANFTGFAPLGVVLVAMLGIGVAEKTGCIGALLKAMMLVTPGSLLTPTMVFVGIMSSMAADAGYVILPPLAAALYKAVGRSPLVGLAAVFAGVSAGYSANLVLTSLDPLLSGLTEEGAQILDPGYTVNPACNLYYMIAATIVLPFVGWAVTAWFVEPRYAKKSPEDGGPAPLTDEDRGASTISRAEVGGLWAAAAALAVGSAAFAAMVLIPGAPLHASGDEPARWVPAIVPMLFVLALVPGVAYGMKTGTIKTATNSDKVDVGVARLMAQSMADMGPYIVLAFFAAQFVQYFNYSNLGVMLAIVGGEALAAANLHPTLLLSLFIIVAGIGNLFIGSASAKYAFFAPVFVPMFMAVGVSPEATQVAYRIGDSVTNIVTPLNPYMIVILVFMQKYIPKAGIGTLVSLMLPYALTFWVACTLMMIVWMTLGLPLGVEGGLVYTPPAQ